MKEEFNFEEIKHKALEQLKSGKSLLGKDGAFAPLLENILNAALEGEMDSHMDVEERSRGNRRNGYMPKQVQSVHAQAILYQTSRVLPSSILRFALCDSQRNRPVASRILYYPVHSKYSRHALL